MWRSNRSKEEDRYEVGVAILYRKYRKWTGIDYSPETIIKTFNFFEYVRPWLFIYMFIAIFFLILFLLR